MMKFVVFATLLAFTVGCAGGSGSSPDTPQVGSSTDTSNPSVDDPADTGGSSDQPADDTSGGNDPSPEDEPGSADEPVSDEPVNDDPGADDSPADDSTPPEEEDTSGEPETSETDITEALEGYGTTSNFGLGGDVCVVENLSDAGPGSLRSCITDRRSADIPLEIQFAVAGDITLTSNLKIDTPFITIDGSTAPAPGITIQTGPRRGLQVIAQTNLNKAHDVLISHLRVSGAWDRLDQTDVEHNNTLVVDCENNDTGSLDVDLNIVLSRMTLMNSPDGGPDLWGACRGITVQQSLMHHNVHPMTISSSSASQVRARISLHRNVFWNNDERNPQIRGMVTDVNYINNIVGGWRWYGVRVRANSSTDHPARINILSNAWLTNDSANSLALEFRDLTNPGVVYTDDNLFPSAEQDRGGSNSMFGSDLLVTRFAAAQLSEVVIGTPSAPLVGTHYPTSEEVQMLTEIQNNLP